MVSDRARRVLANSGWTVDRAVDPVSAQEAVRADGYEGCSDVPRVLGLVEFRRPEDAWSRGSR
jgi:hypothetical protein